MIRPKYLPIVALILLFSCKNSGNKVSEQPDGNWAQVYRNAYTNHDYVTGIVALNHLIISDPANKPAYFDSLALYHIKKQRNFQAGRRMVDSGLALTPDNYNLLEYKSIFLSAEGRIQESRDLLQKAYKLSGQKKHLYMIATTYASEKNIEEYSRIVNGFLYHPETKPEKVEVSIDETTSQMVDIKALCYMDKAKLSTKPAGMLKFIDSALMIAPDYQEALYYREKLVNPAP